MTRQTKAPALVLKMNPVGENHRGLTMLVSGEGLLRPLAYGAQGKRSALRAAAVPFNRGVADLYYDGARDRWRLVAFDPEDTHDGLRDDLDRFYTAAGWAEILLNSHGAGGESAELFRLAAAAYSTLAGADRSDLTRLRAAFLWAFLGIEGIRPDPLSCGRCGAALPPGLGGAAARLRPDGILVGPECAEASWPEMPDGARRWLASITDRELDAATRIGLAESAAATAEAWLLDILRDLLGRSLRSFGP